MKISSFNNREKNGNKEQDVMNKYNELKDLSQDELTRKLFEETSRQKSEGTFDYQKLASTLETLKPYLPQENYQKMKSMLDALK